MNFNQPGNARELADVRQFEQMIAQMFDVKATQDQRQMANKQLMKVCSNLNFSNLAQSIFRFSNNKAALANASSALLQLVSNHWNSFPKDQVFRIRTTIQHVLNNRRDIPHDGTAGMIRILCRITKLGWFEDDSYKKLVLDVQKFLQHTIDAAIIGLRILNELVIEMNQTLPGQTPTAARKTAVSFKDECLFHIFQCSLSMLRQIQENKVNIQNEQQAHDIRKFSLEAAKSVLMFDFIGTNPDESCGEVGTVQVPLSWRRILQDPQTLRLLFEFYEKNQEPHSAKCLELLVYLASVRRSVFSNETERKNFLNRLLEGVRDILRFSRGLNGPDNFHQFCRLLGKVKMNYQLSELVSSDGYMNFIGLLSNFTKKSFEMYKYSNRSTHYLLQLWDRIVSATPYVKSKDSSQGHSVEKHLPGIMDKYVVGRLLHIRDAHQSGMFSYIVWKLFKIDKSPNMYTNIYTGTLDDPLEHPDMCEAQLTHIPKLARYQYKDVCNIITSRSDVILQDYSQIVSQGGVQNAHQQSRFAAIEGQLAWMTRMMGALIGGQIPLLNRQRIVAEGSGEELQDAQLCKRVFQLINFEVPIPRRQGTDTQVQLQLSFLYFLRFFKKAYVGAHKGMPTTIPSKDNNTNSDSSDSDSDDHLSNTPPKSEKQKAYLRMFEAMGRGTYDQVIEFMIQKLDHNLKKWHDNEEIVTQSLELFYSFVTGYSSGRLMLELRIVKENFLSQRAGQNYPFLRSGQNHKHRMLFYKAMSHLIWSNDSPERFEQFISNDLKVLNRHAHASNMRLDPIRKEIVGICCNLRGVAGATHNTRTYTMLFDVLYPNVFPIFAKAIAQCYDFPALTTAVLKFMIEFVENKMQRITFGHCSPNGILLFREVSKIANAFGRVALIAFKQRVPPAELYKKRYKGITLMLNMLTNVFSGKYVNFGVFELYNDTALSSAMAISIQCAGAIPTEHILQYPKVATSYYNFLEILFRSHLKMVVRFDVSVFKKFVHNLYRGLESLNASVAGRCASTIDHIATYYFRHCKKPSGREKDVETARKLQQFILATSQRFFTEMLGFLFKIVLISRDQAMNQWLLSRPILSLMLCDDSAMDNVSKFLISTQNPENQSRLREELYKLKCGTKPNLSQANRDVFSQKLNKFRREILKFMKR